MSSLFCEEHDVLRSQIRRFVADRLAPRVDAWEAARGFPRSVYEELGAAGFLGVGFPEAYGGGGGDIAHMVVLAEELTRSGSPGLAASLGSLAIAVPPILHAGTEDQKHRWLPRVFSGAWISALAVTEPGGGSDVANLQLRATRDGAGWILRGEKTFITSGTRADLIVVAARTGGPGAGGVTLFGVETAAGGVVVGRNIEKMGWHASDTAELRFDDAFVPDTHRIGPENGGFLVAMMNFATERLILAVTAVAIAQLALEDCLAYVRERHAFGRPLVGFQVTRHKLAEMATGIAAARAFNYEVAAQLRRGAPVIGEVAMAKNASTDMCSRVVDAAVQIFGGAGFATGTRVERLYRDARLYPIGGGTREIMNEIIAKQLGL